uniref:Uncharacterized protein n=1 Tax=Arundo donax TaxID=35708 RepID=A0A0A9GJ67_ARUDO
MHALSANRKVSFILCACADCLPDLRQWGMRFLNLLAPIVTCCITSKISK